MQTKEGYGSPSSNRTLLAAQGGQTRIKTEASGGSRREEQWPDMAQSQPNVYPELLLCALPWSFVEESDRRLLPAITLSLQPSVSLQLEQSIQRNLRSNLAQAGQHPVQNQTTTMLSLGANLMNQTTAQTHKLTAVEAQVTGEPSEGQAVPLTSCLCHGPGEVRGLLWA